MARTKQQIQICSCGSGKAAGDCCEGRRQRLVRTAVIGVLLLFTITAVTVLAMSLPTSTASTQPATEIVTPAPYQYDPATNQHWDPSHGHWHPGPPPSNPGGGDGVSAPPNIPNPEPWQYDAASDRHYDPGHAHWHAGAPPAGVDANTLTSPVGTDRVDPPPGVVNPTAWQYDAGTDRHYHPGHRHWHSGAPPPVGQR